MFLAYALCILTSSGRFYWVGSWPMSRLSPRVVSRSPIQNSRPLFEWVFSLDKGRQAELVDA